jgi:hypothetical protein
VTITTAVVFVLTGRDGGSVSILAVVRVAVAAELRYGSRDFLAAFVAVGRLPVVDLRAQRAAATRASAG